MLQIKIQKKSLEEAINTVIKAVPTSTTMPILTSIHIRALEHNMILLTGNDMEMSIDTNVTCEVLGLGEAVIEGKLLNEVVKKLPSEEVSLKASENTATIQCGKAKFCFELKNAAEYPASTLVYDHTAEAEIPKEQLRDMIQKCIFSADLTNASNKLLQCGNLVTAGDNIQMTCLDGHRIAIQKRKLVAPFCETGMNVNIPGKALNEVAKQVKGEGNVRIKCNDTRCQFEFDQTVLTTRLVDGTYFNVSQIINSLAPKTTASFDREMLRAAVDRSTILIREGDKKPIIFDIAEGKATLTVRSTMGEMKEEIPIDLTGEALTIGANPQFVLDVLRCMEDENAIFHFCNSKTPFTASGEEFFYMILPVNIAKAA